MAEKLSVRDKIALFSNRVKSCVPSRSPESTRNVIAVVTPTPTVTDKAISDEVVDIWRIVEGQYEEIQNLRRKIADMDDVKLFISYINFVCISLIESGLLQELQKQKLTIKELNSIAEVLCFIDW
jgi:histidinol-phosphate/aromatic aminotransferase/cobyric acid decarboxylase-like protein